MFLQKIVDQTRLDLQERKRETPLSWLIERAGRQAAPRDFYKALARSGRVQMIAEVKRASPSKGLIAPDLDPVKQAQLYEANGAAAISVLTEPHFFLGSPEYLQAIKQTVNIPVLRKDFIIDSYQVYEARSWGADAILLICAILDDDKLNELLQLAQKLGMHCLVEVHNEEEARRAIASRASIIGVNSRDLVTFQMKPMLIRELRRLIPRDRLVVAESGIYTAEDARRLARYDVQAMLVGESLVISRDVAEQMYSLLASANSSTQIKICGLKTLEHLQVAASKGADLAGLMFYQPSPRYLSPAQALDLINQFRETNEGREAMTDLVGLFVNTGVEQINEITEDLDLHFVQLHGQESPEFCQRINRPVIKALHLNDQVDDVKLQAYREVVWRILLDTPPIPGETLPGGLGRPHDWTRAAKIAQELPIFLAGGLTPENISEAIQQVCPWGVDVSSGVESLRQKDSKKIRQFIERVREADNQKMLSFTDQN